MSASGLRSRGASVAPGLVLATQKLDGITGRGTSLGDRGGGLPAGSPGPGRLGLRALPAHRRAPRAAEAARRARPPRRAPLPDRPPVVRALAPARVERGRGGDEASRGGRDSA